MKTPLQPTADRCNRRLAEADCPDRWQFDNDPDSNSVGSWHIAHLGGVTDARAMRQETDRLIQLFGQADRTDALCQLNPEELAGVLWTLIGYLEAGARQQKKRDAEILRYIDRKAAQILSARQEWREKNG